MRLSLLLFSFILISALWAQEPILKDSGEVLVLDTSQILFEDELDVSDSIQTVGESHDFNEGELDHVYTDKNIPATVSDTTRPKKEFGYYLDSVTNPLVRAIMLDSLKWIAIDSFNYVFDSMTVNPYKYDAVKFKDTLHISLADSNTDSTIHWSMPLDRKHEITSNFGPRWSRYHYGTDLRLSIGDTVRACFDGVVRISKYNRGGYGYYILIRHENGLETLYGHLSKKLKKVGEEVKAGEVIGLGGNTGRSTGPHLHFEVRFRGNAINPKEIYNFPLDTINNINFDLTPKSFNYIREMRAKKYHRIRRGDTLYGIARRYRVSVRQICRLNGISKRTILRIGRRLRVK